MLFYFKTNTKNKIEYFYKKYFSKVDLNLKYFNKKKKN